jgi:hypothetical protein
MITSMYLCLKYTANIWQSPLYIPMTIMSTIYITGSTQHDLQIQEYIN